MKITFIAIGTRGDVQPTIALAKSLLQIGYNVTVVASIHFQSWIEDHGIKVVPSNINFHELMTSQVGHEWVENGGDTTKYFQYTRSIFDRFGLQMMKDALSGCAGARVIVSNHLSQIYAASIAEKLGAIHISMHLMPTLVRTSHWWPMSELLLSGSKAGGALQFDTWLIGPVIWQLIGHINNQFRQKVLGLNLQNFVQNQQKLINILILQGFSSHIVTCPVDSPTNVLMTGFCFLDEEQNWQPPKSLEDFINNGDPPVYIGFGSMTGSNPDHLTRTIINALKLSEKRAIIQSGWAGLGNIQLPSNIFLLEHSIPFNWLFPRVCAIVHHGGAGTTAECFRAGVPMIVVPHMADQTFWGNRALALGVSPALIPRLELNATNLSSAIDSATSDINIINRAAMLGVKIRSEDGTLVASKAIQKAMVVP